MIFVQTSIQSFFFFNTIKIHFSGVLGLDIWVPEHLGSAATFIWRCWNWRRSKIQRIEVNIRGIGRFAAQLQLNGSQEKQIEEKALHTSIVKKKKKKERKLPDERCVTWLLTWLRQSAQRPEIFPVWRDVSTEILYLLTFCTVQCSTKFLRIYFLRIQSFFSFQGGF